MVRADPHDVGPETLAWNLDSSLKGSVVLVSTNFDSDLENYPQAFVC
jgi:hypothetical protein